MSTPNNLNLGLTSLQNKQFKPLIDAFAAKKSEFSKDDQEKILALLNNKPESHLKISDIKESVPLDKFLEPIKLTPKAVKDFQGIFDSVVKDQNSIQISRNTYHDLSGKQIAWKVVRIVLGIVIFPVGVIYVAWKVSMWILGKLCLSTVKAKFLPAAKQNFIQTQKKLDEIETELTQLKPNDPKIAKLDEEKKGLEAILATKKAKDNFVENDQYCSELSIKTYKGSYVDTLIQWNNSSAYSRHNIWMQNYSRWSIAHEKWTKEQKDINVDPKKKVAAAEPSKPYFKEPEEKFIIYFPDGDETYEQILNEHFKICSEKTSLVYFNYAGIGASTGESNSLSDLVDSADSVYRYLAEEMGIKKENIFLHGRGLGGAVAAEVARQNKAIGGVHLENAPASTSAAIAGHVESKIRNDRTVLEKDTEVQEETFTKGATVQKKLISKESKTDPVYECSSSRKKLALGIASIVEKILNPILNIVGWNFDTVATLNEAHKQGATLYFTEGTQDDKILNSARVHKRFVQSQPGYEDIDRKTKKEFYQANKFIKEILVKKELKSYRRAEITEIVNNRFDFKDIAFDIAHPSLTDFQNDFKESMCAIPLDLLFWNISQGLPVEPKILLAIQKAEVALKTYVKALENTVVEGADEISKLKKELKDCSSFLHVGLIRDLKLISNSTYWGHVKNNPLATKLRHLEELQNLPNFNKVIASCHKKANDGFIQRFVSKEVLESNQNLIFRVSNSHNIPYMDCTQKLTDGSERIITVIEDKYIETFLKADRTVMIQDRPESFAKKYFNKTV